MYNRPKFIMLHRLNTSRQVVTIFRLSILGGGGGEGGRTIRQEKINLDGA